MHLFEKWLIWLAISGYAISLGLYVISLVSQRTGFLVYAFRFLVLGLALHGASLAIRMIAASRLLINDIYENTAMGSWLVVLLFVFLAKRRPALRQSGFIVAGFVLLMLAYGLSTGTQEIRPLIPSLQSGWLIAHVVLAWAAYAPLSVAFALGIVFLLKERREGRSDIRPFWQSLPALEMLDRLIYYLIAFGFVFLGFMIATGSIWAKLLKGVYWAWDPIEIWSLMSWITYGTALHLRITLGWKGRRMAWFAVLSLILVLTAFWGVHFLSDISQGIF